MASIQAVALILKIHKFLKFHIKKGKMSNAERTAVDLTIVRFSITNKKGTNAMKIR
jgi:hypothetical protein